MADQANGILDLLSGASLVRKGSGQAQRFPPEILAALIKQGAITAEDMKRMHPADIIQVIKATNDNPKQDASIKESRDSMLSSPLLPPGMVNPIAALGSGWKGTSIPQGAAKLWNAAAPTAGAATGATVAAKAGAPWWIGSLIGGGLGSKLQFGSGWTKGAAPSVVADAPKWPISVEAKVDPEALVFNNAPRGNVQAKGNLTRPGPDASGGPKPTNPLDLKIRDTANEAAEMDLPLKPKGPSNFSREEFPAGTTSKSSSKDFITAANESAEKQGADVKPGERSIESIQEEIAKLLEKATTKRRKP